MCLFYYLFRSKNNVSNVTFMKLIKNEKGISYRSMSNYKFYEGTIVQKNLNDLIPQE